MEPISLTSHTDRTEITLQGVLDVSAARAAYQALNEALIRALPVDLHSAKLERLDGAALQVLAAFHRTVSDRGLRCEWRSVSAALKSGAAALGLTEALGLSA